MATTTASNIYFLLLVSLCGRFGTVHAKQIIALGASLSTVVPPVSWPSPSGRFSFGFYPQGNGFKVGIWLLDGINKTFLWTAYRDDPPVPSNAKLVLTMSGVLLLQNGQGQKTVIAHSNGGIVSSASMKDSGNFVLQNKNSNILWQSFDHPTDTLLGLQILHGGSQLVSCSSDTNQSSGRFQLLMQTDGNLVLYPRYTEDEYWDAYWASDSYGGTSFEYYLFLDTTDPHRLLSIVNASSSDSKILWSPEDVSSFIGNKAIYRATIDYDGILRLYAHFDDEANGTHQVQKLWSPPVLDNLCYVKTFCGFNSYCTNNDNRPYCNCLPGTDFIDPNQQNLGCKRNFSESGCKGGDDQDDANSYYMSSMSSMNIDDLPYTEEDIEEDKCSPSCLQDCYCGAAFYKDGRCKKQKLPLKYVRRELGVSSSSSSSSSFTVYFKVGSQSLKRNNNDTPPIKISSKKAIVQIVIIVLGFAILLCSAAAISSRFIYKIGVLSYKRLLEMGDLGLNEGITVGLFFKMKIM